MLQFADLLQSRVCCSVWFSKITVTSIVCAAVVSVIVLDVLHGI